MNIYVRVMVPSNIARRQEHIINYMYAPEHFERHCVNTLIYQLIYFSDCQRV